MRSMLALVIIVLLVVVAVPLGCTWLRDANAGVALTIEPLTGDAAGAPIAAAPQPFLDNRRIVAYYGNPLTPQMGILGEYEPDG